MVAGVEVEVVVVGTPMALTALSNGGSVVIKAEALIGAVPELPGLSTVAGTPLELLPE